MALQLIGGFDIRGHEPVDAKLSSVNLTALSSFEVYDGLVAYQTTDVAGGLDIGLYILEDSSDPTLTSNWIPVLAGSVDGSSTFPTDPDQGDTLLYTSTADTTAPIPLDTRYELGQLITNTVSAIDTNGFDPLTGGFQSTIRLRDTLVDLTIAELGDNFPDGALLTITSVVGATETDIPVVVLGRRPTFGSNTGIAAHLYLRITDSTTFADATFQIGEEIEVSRPAQPITGGSGFYLYDFISNQLSPWRQLTNIGSGAGEEEIPDFSTQAPYSIGDVVNDGGSIYKRRNTASVVPAEVPVNLVSMGHGESGSSGGRVFFTIDYADATNPFIADQTYRLDVPTTGTIPQTISFTFLGSHAVQSATASTVTIEVRDTNGVQSAGIIAVLNGMIPTASGGVNLTLLTITRITNANAAPADDVNWEGLSTAEEEEQVANFDIDVAHPVGEVVNYLGSIYKRRNRAAVAGVTAVDISDEVTIASNGSVDDLVFTFTGGTNHFLSQEGTHRYFAVINNVFNAGETFTVSFLGSDTMLQGNTGLVSEILVRDTNGVLNPAITLEAGEVFEIIGVDTDSTLTENLNDQLTPDVDVNWEDISGPDTNTTYTAGNGIGIDENNVITSTVVGQDVLYTAGLGVDISTLNVISAEQAPDFNVQTGYDVGEVVNFERIIYKRRNVATMPIVSTNIPIDSISEDDTGLAYSITFNFNTAYPFVSGTTYFVSVDLGVATYSFSIDGANVVEVFDVADVSIARIDLRLTDSTRNPNVTLIPPGTSDEVIPTEDAGLTADSISLSFGDDAGNLIPTVDPNWENISESYFADNAYRVHNGENIDFDTVDDATTGINTDPNSTLRTRLTGVLGTVLQFSAVNFDDLLNADGTRRGILEYTFTRFQYDKYILNPTFEYCVTTVNTLPSRAILVLQQTPAERAQTITDLDAAEATRTGDPTARAQRVDVLFKPITVIADGLDRAVSRTATEQADLVLGTVPLTNIDVSQLSFIREVVARRAANITTEIPLTFNNVDIQGFTTDNGNTSNVDRIDFRGGVVPNAINAAQDASNFFDSLPQQPGRFELRIASMSYFFDFASLFQYTAGDTFIIIPAVSSGTVRFPLTAVNGNLINIRNVGFDEIAGGTNITLDVDTPNVLTINTPGVLIDTQTTWDYSGAALPVTLPGFDPLVSSIGLINQEQADHFIFLYGNGGTMLFDSVSYTFASAAEFTTGGATSSVALTFPAGTTSFPSSTTAGTFTTVSFERAITKLAEGANIRFSHNTTGDTTISANVQDRTVAWAIASTGRVPTGTFSTQVNIGGQVDITRLRYIDVTGTGYILPGSTTEDTVWFEFIGVALNAAGTGFDLDASGSVYSSHINPFDTHALTIRAF